MFLEDLYRLEASKPLTDDPDRVLYKLVTADQVRKRLTMALKTGGRVEEFGADHKEKLSSRQADQYFDRINTVEDFRRFSQEMVRTFQSFDR